jgi:phage gp46-like protein
MDFQIDTTGGLPFMTWNKNTDIRSDILLSLEVHQGTFFADLTFGSKLYTIKSITDANLLLANQYVLQALQWLKQTGKATSITAVATKYTYNTMQIALTVIQANGTTLFYNIYNDVMSGKVSWAPVGD